MPAATNTTAARKQVLDRLDTCGAGRIRNPRTDRCVRRDRPLGRALVAAAQALRAGAEMPACAKAGEAYDHAEQGCTSDRYRAPALRDLLTRYEWARAANNSGTTGLDDSRALARLIASQALAKATAANNRRSHAADLTEAGAMVERLATYGGGLRSQANSNEQTILRLQAALELARRERELCRRDLEGARQKAAQIERALVAANADRAPASRRSLRRGNSLNRLGEADERLGIAMEKLQREAALYFGNAGTGGARGKTGAARRKAAAR